MTLNEALAILETHQKWRRGDEIEPTCPIRLGEAIDVILKKVKKN